MRDAAHIYLCLSRHQTVWLGECFTVEELGTQKLIDASLMGGVQDQTGFVDLVPTHNGVCAEGCVQQRLGLCFSS